MSLRATKFGTGAPGGQIEYHGDLTPPVSSYAASAAKSPLISTLLVPASTVVSGAAVVNRQPRRGGHRFFYSHGAVPMPPALPGSGPGIGGVFSSLFQRFNIQLMDWQINTSWYESGYPRNLAWSTRVPQLQTNVTGGPGKSQQTQRPLFTRVQTVPRATVRVRSYPTKAAKS